MHSKYYQPNVFKVYKVEVMAFMCEYNYIYICDIILLNKVAFYCYRQTKILSKITLFPF